MPRSAETRSASSAQGRRARRKSESTRDWTEGPIDLKAWKRVPGNPFADYDPPEGIALWSLWEMPSSIVGSVVRRARGPGVYRTSVAANGEVHLHGHLIDQRVVIAGAEDVLCRERDAERRVVQVGGGPGRAPGVGGTTVGDSRIRVGPAARFGAIDRSYAAAFDESHGVVGNARAQCPRAPANSDFDPVDDGDRRYIEPEARS